MSNKTWGIRLNHTTNYTRLTKGQLPEGCPSWLQPHRSEIWQRQGLVIWNNVEQKIEVLTEAEALDLLNTLVTSENWKLEGIRVTRWASRFIVPISTSRRKRQKEKEPQSEEVSETKTEQVQVELVSLPPEAGVELIQVLQENKPFLVEQAARKEKEWQKKLVAVYEMLFKASRTAEETVFQFQNRQVHWEPAEKKGWVCQYEQVQGQVCLDKNYFFWFARVKKLGATEKSERFIALAEAVSWVEAELPQMANLPTPEKEPWTYSEERILANRIRLEQKIRNSPYWIEPSSLEPERSTYQVLIELDAQPLEYKTLESLFGEPFRYDYRYFTPSKLAAALGLDFDHFKIEQPAGENTEWFQITSLTTFYVKTIAFDQAFKIWEQSRILSQCKAGKINRVRYGCREIETGYCEYLGGYEDPKNPWYKEPSRTDHMALLALRESLCYALDVNDYRDYLGVSSEILSDERLLETMHQTRAKSKYIPSEAQRTSKLWLVK